MKENARNFDEYLLQFPPEVQEMLIKIRETIKQHAPDAVESISYGMPAFKTFGKPLVYFAGYSNHIGFYATPTGHEEFKNELSKYNQGKGSVQFPLNQAIPFDLIARITAFRAEENRVKASRKKIIKS